MRIQGLNNNYYNINNNKQMRNNNIVDTGSKDAISFKGGKESKFEKAVGKFFAKHYGDKVLNSKKLQDISEKLAKMNLGDMTVHLAVIGSIITSGVYVGRTIKSDKIKSENKPALAANQTACCIIPTFGNYYLDKKLTNKIKKLEYRYAGLHDQMHALDTKMTPQALKDSEKLLAQRLKFFRSMSRLAMVTFIYRFATPVLVTPGTNAIGNWWNKRNDKKAEQQAQKETIIKPLSKPEEKENMFAENAKKEHVRQSA